MPIPHQTQMRLIRRRLAGKEGSDRLRELRAILGELPNYKNGPYADLRKWVHAQVAETRIRSRITQRDSIAVRREGAAQVALVGPPNGGKSSLLQALSNVQIKIGDYAFTTTRPVPALTRIGGVLVQLVEIPGLIPGAADDRGGGRALLGVLREADAVLFCQDLGADPQSLREVRAEVERAGIELPALLVATKLDEAPDGALEALRRATPELRVVAVTVLDEQSLGALRNAVWGLVDLVRVYLRLEGAVGEEPIALPRGATVADVAAHIHGDLGTSFAGARVWGRSARFDGQRVGREHAVCDGDQVEILR